MKRFLPLLLIAFSIPGFAQKQTPLGSWLTILPAAPGHNFFYTPRTWFVRADGGPIYYMGLAGDSCDGLADTAMTVSGGANQHCAVLDFRYLYDTGQFGNWVWVIAGGDTVVIRGCKAAGDQQSPDNPHCRIGYDTSTGPGTSNWCAGSQPTYWCGPPDLPSGTIGAHTRILGGCAYDGACNPVTTYPYTSNLAQLFGGFGVQWILSLRDSDYVDIKGLEIAGHNGVCVEHGVPAWPKNCSNSSPADDYAVQGIFTTATSTHVLLEDVYIHGFTSGGLFGAIGAGVVLNRVSSDFNGFAGWNMDNGGSSNGAGATLTQSYVTMIGNGCNEEYPIVHPLFPAKSCYDTNSAGFGDSWSGQTCNLADPNCSFTSFTCDHCWIAYNTKDGATGPHVPFGALTLTNSFWAGNKGAGGKWSIGTGHTFTFQNNIFVQNCERLLSIMPGAAQSFNVDTGLDGSYLSGCRGNDMFAYDASASSTSNFANNTFVFVRASSGPPNQEVAFDLGCTDMGVCGTANLNFTNNIFLGYPSNDLTKPALFFVAAFGTGTINVSHNVEYNMRAGETCGGTIICSDPLLLNEPALGLPAANMDVFNPGGSSGAQLTMSSPAITAGTTYSGQPTTDYYGTAWTPVAGAVVFGSTPTAATPTCTPAGGVYSSTQTVTCSSTTPASTTRCTTNGSTPNGSSPVCTSISVATSLTIKAFAQAGGYLDSGVDSEGYTINIPGTTTTITGAVMHGVAVQ